MRAWTMRQILLVWCAWLVFLALIVSAVSYWLRHPPEGTKVSIGPAEVLPLVKALPLLALYTAILIGPPLLITFAWLWRRQGPPGE